MMADVTGTLRHDYEGKTYSLRLTCLGLAKLQDIYGSDLGGLLSGRFDGEGATEIPPFRLMVDVVATALEKGEKMGADEALDLADEMVTADKPLMGRVLATAFPEAQPGNAPAPKAKR